MIPLLSLGVPGDSVTAILLGAFIMKGIQPGPMMYVSELPTVYKVFAALMLANLAMLLVGCAGVRVFAKIVSLEKRMLYPIILVVSLLGAFSINKNVFDVGVCVLFGVIGWLMNKYEFPLSPILLALILGPMCEQNFVLRRDHPLSHRGRVLCGRGRRGDLLHLQPAEDQQAGSGGPGGLRRGGSLLRPGISASQ